MSLKLNLGCGLKKKEGWINIDSASDCHPDILLDLSEPLPFEDQSVDEILADAVLEHFDKYARYFLLCHWVKVLKIGGTLRISVPNFQKIIHRYFKWDFNDFVDTIFGETMWTSKYYIGHFGSHKWGYSEKTLKEFLEIFGIGKIGIKKEGLGMMATGQKVRHVPYQELQDIKIYSPNNAHGDGKVFMTLEEIRKIAGFKNS